MGNHLHQYGSVVGSVYLKQTHLLDLNTGLARRWVHAFSFIPNVNSSSEWISYRAVLLSRFFLGFTEAVYYPGALLIVSRWYVIIFFRGSSLSKRGLVVKVQA